MRPFSRAPSCCHASCFAHMRSALADSRAFGAHPRNKEAKAATSARCCIMVRYGAEDSLDASFPRKTDRVQLKGPGAKTNAPRLSMASGAVGTKSTQTRRLREIEHGHSHISHQGASSAMSSIVSHELWGIWRSGLMSVGAEHGLSRTFLSVAHRRRSNGAHGFREFDWTES
jgi:hypothetical protein